MLQGFQETLKGLTKETAMCAPSHGSGSFLVFAAEM